MRPPEVPGSSPEEINNPSLFPIRYEYSGNFYSDVNFNPEIIQRLIRIIGRPKTPLIIRDGNLSREDFIKIPVMDSRGWPTIIPLGENKPNVSIDRINDAIIASINSAVIDGRIQKEHPNFTLQIYKSSFIETLIKTISAAIFIWSLNIMVENLRGRPRWELATVPAAFLTFWVRNRKGIITPSTAQ
ncbi:hypothetical protein HYV21_01925 [Candidatus Microgenomates bacterium]|nr:hypothetical protein [Candidatus Microgenomates bacterium]